MSLQFTRLIPHSKFVPTSFTSSLKRFNVELSGAKQSIEVTGVQGWEAKLLHIEDTDLVMKIERQTFDIYKIPVEYVVSKYRADKYKLYIELF